MQSVSFPAEMLHMHLDELDDGSAGNLFIRRLTKCSGTNGALVGVIPELQKYVTACQLIA